MIMSSGAGPWSVDTGHRWELANAKLPKAMRLCSGTPWAEITGVGKLVGPMDSGM